MLALFYKKNEKSKTLLITQLTYNCLKKIYFFSAATASLARLLTVAWAVLWEYLAVQYPPCPDLEVAEEVGLSPSLIETTLQRWAPCLSLACVLTLRFGHRLNFIMFIIRY